MRTQEARDRTTLEIFTALLIFTLVLVLGAALMFLVNQLVGAGAVLDTLGYAVLGCASVVATVYLWRHRRP